MKFLVYHNRTTYFGKLSLHLERCRVLPKGKKRFLNEKSIVKVSALGMFATKVIRVFSNEVCVLIVSHFALQIKLTGKRTWNTWNLKKYFVESSGKKLVPWSSELAPSQTAVCVMDTSSLNGYTSLMAEFRFLFVLTCLLWLPLWFVLANCVFYPGSSIIKCRESLTSFYSRCHAEAARSDSAATDSKEEVVKA